ncbi:hypothetical protein B0I37DRAFT_155157 [Chaetomium sp. MPI-CAGE-AT-0009]|nr:hypothetical protein B0I37DRAFT_155157 [Chaetomium sp. MPI-CAGE-AT-0009]
MLLNGLHYLLIASLPSSPRPLSAASVNASSPINARLSPILPVQPQSQLDLHMPKMATLDGYTTPEGTYRTRVSKDEEFVLLVCGKRELYVEENLPGITYLDVHPLIQLLNWI